MMGYVDIKMLIFIPVDNKFSSIYISHVIIEMLSIINIISYNPPIDYAHYHTPYFNVFVCWYWSIPEQLSRIIT